METDNPGTAQEPGKNARNALRGAALGYFVDMFDIYLPVIVIAPALIYFVRAGTDLSTTSLVGGSIFAAALLGRPVGAAIFGHFADTLGRRRATFVAVAGFGVCTLLLGLLPGYQSWGSMAIITFIGLRFVGGIFLGGEYTAANPLAMESAPPGRRGLYSAIINCGFGLAYAACSLITLALLHWLPSATVDSAYVQWGWRIPFFIGAALSFALLGYYRFAVGESELWRGAEHTRSPIRQLFSSGGARRFGQIFVLMTGIWLASETATAILPIVLRVDTGLTSTTTTAVLTVSFLFLLPVNLTTGVLGQRYGRRRALIVLAVLALTVAMLTYFLLASGHPGNLFVVCLLSAVTVAIIVVPFGILPAYINERFTLGVRSSGYGLAYSLPVILPSFYSFYQLWLGHIMPAKYTALVLLGVGALCALAGAVWGPETKDAQLGSTRLEEELVAG